MARIKVVISERVSFIEWYRGPSPTHLLSHDVWSHAAVVGESHQRSTEDSQEERETEVGRCAISS